jgi:hypothetical protein
VAYDSFVVEWDKLDPQTYEVMVSVLLSNLHPDAKRTDGSGGDGGKDVSFPTPKGLEIFELKSFTGRMTPARWRQVEGSLARGRELEPAAWHLVLPIDFTPAEEAKFAEVIADSAFACDYFGLTWLNAQMAEHPRIPRYFLQGGAARVVELLTELGKEEANLTGGVPDLAARLQRLSQRADEIDPHYRLGFGVSDTGAVSVSLSPRYPGAELDRPITITTSFAFPTTPEGLEAHAALTDAIRFGISAVIPSEYVKKVLVDAPAGLGGEHEGGHLVIGGTPITGSEFPINMVLIGPDKRRLASLPLTVGQQTIGAAGFEATATDPSGCIRCRMRTDIEAKRMQLSYEVHLPPTCLPSLALPTVRFLAIFGVPNQMQLELPDGSPLNPPYELDREPPVAAEYVDIVKAFERLQAHGQVYFNLPSTLSQHDFEELLESDVLLRGETATSTWTPYTMGVIGVGTFVELGRASGIDVLAGESFTQWVVGDFASDISGHKIPLGVCTRRLFSAVVDNLDEVNRAFAEDPTREIEVRLRPGSDDHATLKLGPPDEQTQHATVTRADAGRETSAPAATTEPAAETEDA